jgi:hypothetical protein
MNEKFDADADFGDQVLPEGIYDSAELRRSAMSLASTESDLFSFFIADATWRAVMISSPVVW